jgi:hypothetical protein
MDSKIEKMVTLMFEGAATKAVKSQRTALWDSLSRDEQQQARESLMFIGFAKDTGLIGDPYNHFNEYPQRPDIRTSIKGHDYYFELGEITDQELAKGVSVSMKSKKFSGCAFSQGEPLEKMLRQKCKKTYQTDRAPVDLLLFYWIQSPDEESIDEYLNANISEVRELIQSSQFERIWIYDSDSGEVLWKREKYTGWRKCLWLLGKMFLLLKRKLRRGPHP